MSRRVGFALAVLAVALTFTGASGHVSAKHAYVGVFTRTDFPSPAVVWAQDLVAPESGQVIGFGVTWKLTCFALVRNVGQGHVFRAFGTAGGEKYGFEFTDNAGGNDVLKLWARTTLTNKSTCKFGFPGSPIRAIGVGAAAG